MLVVLVLFFVTLCVGNTFYPPTDVVRVLVGDQVAGASFTVGRLRLPRAVVAVLAGVSFGLAGAAFQVMLRNPLASPDIVGITSGASAAAVLGIIGFGLSGGAVSAMAVALGLLTALLIYVLAYRDGVVGARLILIGIGVGALLDSVVSYLLLQGSAYDVQSAMRWLTGSLNSAVWSQVPLLALAVAVLAPPLFLLTRRLQLLQLGDDLAATLGLRLERTRLLLIVTAVGLASFATATTGPIAFVAFLSAPIAFRLVGPGGGILLPAALVGATLVLAGDLAGQYFFDTRFPVGVITGAVGAPYLLYLLARSNRVGGSL